MNENLNLVNSLYETLGFAIEAINHDPHPTPNEGAGVTVGYGDHVITVSFTTKPKDVFVSIVDQDSGGCGQGGVSKAGVSVLEDHFLIYATVTANSALLKWVVTN